VKYADPGASAAWRGAAVSQTLRFEILGANPKLEEQPQAGCASRRSPIRAASALHGEPIPMAFLVENVTEAPIELARDVGGSQDDDVKISDAAGAEPASASRTTRRDRARTSRCRRALACASTPGP
jgi:hypothetical protein